MADVEYRDPKTAKKHKKRREFLKKAGHRSVSAGMADKSKKLRAAEKATNEGSSGSKRLKRKFSAQEKNTDSDSRDSRNTVKKLVYKNTDSDSRGRFEKDPSFGNNSQRAKNTTHKAKLTKKESHTQRKPNPYTHSAEGIKFGRDIAKKQRDSNKG